MKVHILKAVAIAWIVQILINTLFFLLSMGRPIDFLRRVLFSSPVPIVLGITAVGLSRWKSTDVNGGTYKWLAALGMLGGYLGSLFTASVLLTSESYVWRMVAYGLSQIVIGVMIQVMLVLVFQLWSTRHANE